MKSIKTSEFTYTLPTDRIALRPVSQRDQAQMLVYDQGSITHKHFYQLPELIASDSLLVFNNTKVIPARILFTKETGAMIEIFLLNPAAPSVPFTEAIHAKGTATWKCTIGNLKRWTEGTFLKKSVDGVSIEAHLENREAGIVRFEWQGMQSFFELINVLGETPLPPYLNRAVESEDKERYQTVYANLEGAVAAPTAGLHFTPAVFQALEKKSVHKDFLTLHVSAGTFQPVKAEDAREHKMHNEEVVITKANVENLLAHADKIIPVGTTSMRTLESLYWYGVMLMSDPSALFNIQQFYPYEFDGTPPSRKEVLEKLLNHMDENKLEALTGETSIFIVPGYTFRMCDALITNFHQPGSTLILLVAAFIGPDWKKIYEEALNNGYRFLSYGDSSLLFPVNESLTT